MNKQATRELNLVKTETSKLLLIIFQLFFIVVLPVTGKTATALNPAKLMRQDPGPYEINFVNYTNSVLTLHLYYFKDGDKYYTIQPNSTAHVPAFYMVQGSSIVAKIESAGSEASLTCKITYPDNTNSGCLVLKVPDSFKLPWYTGNSGTFKVELYRRSSCCGVC